MIKKYGIDLMYGNGGDGVMGLPPEIWIREAIRETEKSILFDDGWVSKSCRLGSCRDPNSDFVYYDSWEEVKELVVNWHKGTVDYLVRELKKAKVELKKAENLKQSAYE